MELVRYRAGEAIRWLQTGADNIRKGAQDRGKRAVSNSPVDVKGVGENIKNAAGALLEYGKGTYADVIHRQADASEYVLQEKHFDIVKSGSMKSVSYDRIKSIELKGDKATLTLDRGTVAIKPFAHIVAGRVKVPVGWSRNGMEVPFELLIEELAARASVEVTEE